MAPNLEMTSAQQIYDSIITWDMIDGTHIHKLYCICWHAHGAYIGVNLGPMLGMVLKNKFNLLPFILHWKLLAKQPFREKTVF